jgi:hypothetical protein
MAIANGSFGLPVLRHVKSIGWNLAAAFCESCRNEGDLSTVSARPLIE